MSENDGFKEGVVKWFNESKGYGFISVKADPESGQGETDVFVHFSGIDSTGYKTLTEGDVVVFRLQSSSKGQAAVDVRRKNA